MFSLACIAEMGCSEVAIKYLSSPSPWICFVRTHYFTSRRTNPVKRLVKLGELSCLRHHLLSHHEGSLDLLVSLLSKERKTVVDQSHVEVDSISGQEVSTVSGNLDSCIVSLSLSSICDG
jgi:hypothetical protein